MAPFKAQNMSNNAGVTRQGGEMGRAQVVQAEAAGIEPHTDMNPVLLKPEADLRSQIVLNGQVHGAIDSSNWMDLKRSFGRPSERATTASRADTTSSSSKGQGLQPRST